MIGAAKRKSLSPAGLTALRVLLLLVVTLCLGQTRVWGFGITAPPASGVFESANPSSIGENTIGSGYDASNSLLAARGTIPSSGGVIRQFEQAADQTYYRVFSGDATAGKWLTAVPPRSSAFAQEGLALPPWNAANMIQEVRVPAGTMLERSRAIPVPEWGRFRGGAEQFQLLDEIPLNSFGPGVPLR
jgi:hypothetical protein